MAIKQIGSFGGSSPILRNPLSKADLSNELTIKTEKAMYLQGKRRDGTPYTPEFVETVEVEKCLGCGRCFKVCSHNVYSLVERANLDLEDDDYEEEGAMVMIVANPGNCIGCTACGKVCSRKCHVFKPLAA